MSNQYTYGIRGNAVVIHQSVGDLVIKASQLRQSIETVMAQRAAYRTEEAYQVQLKKYQDALDFAIRHGLVEEAA